MIPAAPRAAWVASVLVIGACGGGAAPGLAEEACTHVAAFLRTLSGTSVDRATGPVEDPLRGVASPGCRVHARGTLGAVMAAPSPDLRLRTWFDERGWRTDPSYDADGPDGTAFARTAGGVRCFVRVGWDGGDDADPAYVPEDWFEADLGCIANAADRSAGS